MTKWDSGFPLLVVKCYLLQENELMGESHVWLFNWGLSSVDPTMSQEQKNFMNEKGH